MTDTTIYELPLKERVRTFLRLEFLFQQARYSMRGYSVWDSRSTISHILDILSIMSRIDLRSELIQELERQSTNLLAVSSRPGVDSSILEHTLAKLADYIQSLKAPQASDDVRNNELLKLIQQRHSIPGGSCDFDIPAYHYWLKQQPEQRIEILEAWLDQLDCYRLGINFILELLRESAVDSPAIAANGFYQQSLDISIPYQLIRVSIPNEANIFAEMSGGKHRFSIRFMTPVAGERPMSCTTDIDFQLSCCAL